MKLIEKQNSRGLEPLRAPQRTARGRGTDVPEHAPALVGEVQLQELGLGNLRGGAGPAGSGRSDFAWKLHGNKTQGKVTLQYSAILEVSVQWA